MQIDFHHATTYVLARLAGLPRPQAEIVAYAAEYVDDATNDGPVRFENGALYDRLASAHKMLDYRNFAALANHRVWVPFHFLPGNGGLEAGKSPPGAYVDRLVCKPDSVVARELVRAAVEARERPWGLHLLGVTMHVYADTWAHQGFVGLNHELNEVHDVVGEDGRPDQDLLERLANYFIGSALPIGHGAALSYPDRPWLRWAYVDGRGRRVERDNLAIFLGAVDGVYEAIRRFVTNRPSGGIPRMAARDREAIAALLGGLRAASGDERHAAWLDAIGDGTFSFGADRGLRYIAKGEGSWKHVALGTVKARDDEDDRFPFSADFLQSDWKRFHDALQVFRLRVLVDVLPRYGIVAA